MSTYIDGFVAAVPNASRQEFTEHAEKAAAAFRELGAIRVVECWGDDVGTGELTDFRRAVRAEEGETVVFSWIEWPDRQTRNRVMGRIDELMQFDERLNPQANPMPFDRRRMIFGGFVPVVQL